MGDEKSAEQRTVELENAAREIIREKTTTDSIIDSLPGVFYQISPEGKFVRWNRTFEKVTGRSYQEMETIDPLDLFPEADKERVAAAIQSVFVTGQGEVEADFLAKDGSSRPYYFTGTLKTIDKKPYLVGMGIDVSKLKEAQAELHLKNIVFESSISANSISDTTGVLTHVNPAFLERWGYTEKKEVIGRSIAEFFENIEDTAPVMEALTSSGEWGGEFLAKRKDGTTFIAQSLSTVVKNEQGELIGYQSAVVDNTKQKKAEEELAESETRLKSILESMDDSVIVIDLQGKITDVNRAFKESFGYRGEEVIGSSPVEMVAKEDVPDVMAAMKQTMQTGSAQNIQFRFNTKSGTAIPVLANATLMKNARGEPTSQVAVVRDITEIVRAQEERERLLYDMGERVKEINTLYGVAEAVRTREDLPDLFRKVTDILPSGVQYPEISCARVSFGGTSYQTRNFSESPWSLSANIIVKGEKQGMIEVRYLEEKSENYEGPFLSEEHKLLNGVAHQLGESLEGILADSALQKTMEELERSNEELTKFAYVASHDLQEPLRKIRSFSELLEKRYHEQLDEKAGKYLDYITGGATRMQHLINDLLSYSRVTTTGKELKSVSGEELMDKTLGEMKGELEESKATVTHDPLPFIKVDAAQMRTVFRHLVDNAIKFKGEEDPRVHIFVQEGSGEWIFSVKDNGIGIEEQFRDRIFQVFQRLHKRDAYSGTGIGLALCKKIVERHGGRVWVESRPGKGSTFYFTIPTTTTSGNSESKEDEFNE